MKISLENFKMSTLSQQNLQELQNFYAWKRQRQIDEAFNMSSVVSGMRAAGRFARGAARVAGTAIKTVKSVKDELTDPTTGFIGSVKAGIQSRNFDLKQIAKNSRLSPSQRKQRIKSANLGPERALRGLEGRVRGRYKVNLDSIRDSVKSMFGLQGSQRSQTNPPNPNEGKFKKGVRVLGGALYDTIAQKTTRRYPSGGNPVDKAPDFKTMFMVNALHRFRNITLGTPLPSQRSWKQVNPKNDPIRQAQAKTGKNINNMFP